jgi:undecaprenyl-diphosphatase
MDWIEALILGIIQGLTEFLPISSTGHLYLGRHWFGLDEAGLFLDTMLHFGTLIAVIAVYADDLSKLIKNPWQKQTVLIIVGTLPSVVIGFAFADFFDELSKTGATIGCEFLATGLILWLAQRYKQKGSKQLHEITVKDAFIIGVFQSAAILPALSRSGFTIAAALFCKIDKKAAAYFSFLLSIPAIAGGIVLQSTKLFTGQAAAQIGLIPLLIAVFAAAVSGYLAIRYMIHVLQNGTLNLFALYVTVLGVIILIAQWLHLM